jgi:hypothetical protein
MCSSALSSLALLASFVEPPTLFTQPLLGVSVTTVFADSTGRLQYTVHNHSNENLIAFVVQIKTTDDAGQEHHDILNSDHADGYATKDVAMLRSPTSHVLPHHDVGWLNCWNVLRSSGQRISKTH